MMKVLVNGLLMNDRFSGVEYSIEHLLQAISRKNISGQYIEVLVSDRYAGELKSKENFRLRDVQFSTAYKPGRVLYENFLLGKYFAKANFNLYHSTVYVLPFFSNIPSVLTVHDLIALDFPQFCKNRTAAYYNLFLPRSVHTAKRIIAVSNVVRRDIMQRFGISEEKIDVIHHGVDSLFKPVVCREMLRQVISRYQLPPKFILFVGNLEPKKNLVRLINAFIELRKNAAIEHKLVIAGKEGWKYRNIYHVVEREQLHSEVLFTGYVARKDLPAIYSLADLFVLPSLYEGFGLPVLEAMACGTPVLVSGEGALPEVTGNIFPSLDAYNIKDIARKLMLYLSDTALREKVIDYGLRRAREFSWDNAAAKTLMTYRQAIAMQTRPF
jgi:glycosyltransferase involved in cell wall biosynthesis